MQSGIHRGQYGKEKRLAHAGAVRGTETDLCNQRVITAGSDNKLKFWHFKNGKILVFIDILVFGNGTVFLDLNSVI